MPSSDIIYPGVSPLRIEFEDALYHVTARGDRPEPIFEDLDRDAAIAGAYLEGGYTRSAIAQATGLSMSWCSRLIAAHEAKGKDLPSWKMLVLHAGAVRDAKRTT